MTNNGEESSIKEVLHQLEKLSSQGHEKLLPNDDHKFWKTQPVPQDDSQFVGNEPIEENKLPEEVQLEPYPLPTIYKWCNINIRDEDEMKELYTLLTNNYVEDDDCLFRFNYPGSFLSWALLPPGVKDEWFLGVRVTETNRLVAFISAIPITMSIFGKIIPKMVQVNFLCIHKKLRSKRLSPVLIKEITRRVHLYGGAFQAVYTAGVTLPHSIARCQYYHRPLNIQKLVQSGFTSLPNGVSIDKVHKLYELKLPKGYTTSTTPLSMLYPGLREMTSKDVPLVFNLLNTFLSANGQTFHTVFTSEAELAHWLLPRPDLVYSYVSIKDKNTGSSPSSEEDIDAFISFYALPSTVLRPNQTKYTSINTAYLFYYALKKEDDGKIDKTKLIPLMKTMLMIAKDRGFDVFNCLDCMSNMEFIENLKFGKGDGQLHYYLYNWKTKPIESHQVGLLML